MNKGDECLNLPPTHQKNPYCLLLHPLVAQPRIPCALTQWGSYSGLETERALKSYVKSNVFLYPRITIPIYLMGLYKPAYDTVFAQTLDE